MLLRICLLMSLTEYEGITNNVWDSTMLAGPNCAVLQQVMNGWPDDHSFCVFMLSWSSTLF